MQLGSSGKKLINRRGGDEHDAEGRDCSQAEILFANFQQRAKLSSEAEALESRGLE